MSECKKRWPPNSADRCCCNCAFHLRDYHHCTVTAGREETRARTGKQCVCSEPRGWVCATPSGDGRVFSGWSEHGLCERHEYAEAKKGERA